MFFDFFVSFILILSICFWPYVSINIGLETTFLGINNRGMHGFRSWIWGGLRCIVCRLCEVVCPTVALVLRAASNNNTGLRTVSLISLVYRRCIFCGWCSWVCPTDAITHLTWVIPGLNWGVMCCNTRLILVSTCIIFDLFAWCLV